MVSAGTKAVLAAAVYVVASSFASPVRADNQTPAATLSPVVIGASLPFSTQIQTGTTFSDSLPTLQSFSKAQYGGEWLLIGGITNGSHVSGLGFVPDAQNANAIVIDPNTHQVWSRSLANDAASGLTIDQYAALSTNNAQYSQIGSKLYIAGGYGPGPEVGATGYTTYDTLTSIDLPGLMNWVKSAPSPDTAISHIRQINDPLFQVTGGDLATTSNGSSHLIFGQNYPFSYSFHSDGEYTFQVRSFRIVDDANGLSVTDVNVHPTNDDFRRRDLNVVPIIQKVGGQLVDKYQALAGVFTQDFGGWTVPVTIDGNGDALEPDPNAPGTFRQGMNTYRSGNIGLYSAKTNTMHTLLFGGISYLYFDPITQSTKGDQNLPYINDCTLISTDAQGNMTQYLLPSSFPDAISNLEQTLFYGAETEFFLKEGVPTFANGVIDLDALTGPTLVGYLYGGIISDAQNFANTVASNLLFPVIITPAAVPEPATLAMAAVGALALLRRRRGV